MSHRQKHRVAAAVRRDIRRIEGRPGDPSNRDRTPRVQNRCPSCEFPIRHRWQFRLHAVLNACATVRP